VKQLISPTILHQNYEEIAANCVLPACGCMYGSRMTDPYSTRYKFWFWYSYFGSKTLLSLRDLIYRVQLEKKKKPFFLPHKHNTQHKERSFPQNSLKRVLKIYQNPVLQLDIDNGNGPMWTPWMKFIQSWQQKLTFIPF